MKEQENNEWIMYRMFKKVKIFRSSLQADGADSHVSPRQLKRRNASDRKMEKKKAFSFLEHSMGSL
jgi:hypothetical protein